MSYCLHFPLSLTHLPQHCSLVVRDRMYMYIYIYIYLLVLCYNQFVSLELTNARPNVRRACSRTFNLLLVTSHLSPLSLIGAHIAGIQPFGLAQRANCYGCGGGGDLRLLSLIVHVAWNAARRVSVSPLVAFSYPFARPQVKRPALLSSSSSATATHFRLGEWRTQSSTLRCVAAAAAAGARPIPLQTACATLSAELLASRVAVCRPTTCCCAANKTPPHG